MPDAVAQRASDSRHEHGAVLSADRILPLLRAQARIQAAELLGVDEMDLLRQAGGDDWVFLAHHELGTHDGRPDAADYILQILGIAFAFGHHPLPVPLIHVEGVDVVQLLIRADSVHVGVDAIAGLDAVLRKGQTLPFGKRMHYLAYLPVHILHRETHGALDAVQVVIDAGALTHEQRSRHTAQAQLGGKVHLEEILDLLDGAFRLTRVQQRGIVIRDLQFHSSLFI